MSAEMGHQRIVVSAKKEPRRDRIDLGNRHQHVKI